jgi:hypothetical protein
MGEEVEKRYLEPKGTIHIMAEITERYKGIELYGSDGERIGTIVGQLTADDRHQYYVVERGGFLGFGKTRYYVPADRGVAAGSRRLNIDATAADLAGLGWDRSPTETLPNPAA